MVTEYYQQLPVGSLVKMKPLMDTEKPLPRPQTDAIPAQGLSHMPLNTLMICLASFRRYYTMGYRLMDTIECFSCSCMYQCFILSIDLSSLPLFVNVVLIAEAT